MGPHILTELEGICKKIIFFKSKIFLLQKLIFGCFSALWTVFGHGAWINTGPWSINNQILSLYQSILLFARYGQTPIDGDISTRFFNWMVKYKLLVKRLELCLIKMFKT